MLLLVVAVALPLGTLLLGATRDTSKDQAYGAPLVPAKVQTLTPRTPDEDGKPRYDCTLLVDDPQQGRFEAAAADCPVTAGSEGQTVHVRVDPADRDTVVWQGDPGYVGLWVWVMGAGFSIPAAGALLLLRSFLRDRRLGR
jgi:hypothetical protein